MSVIVRGMEMPKTCDECPLFSSMFSYGCDIASLGIPSRHNYDTSKRPDWCPLEDAEEVYMKHYKQGRLDEAAEREGRLMQAFSPD